MLRWFILVVVILYILNKVFFKKQSPKIKKVKRDTSNTNKQDDKNKFQ